MAVTVQQIADATGVSRGTVDRALNNRGRVDPEVAERIRRTAEEMGYVKKPRKTNGKRKSCRIGIVTQLAGASFMREINRGIREAAEELRDRDVEVLVRESFAVDEKEQVDAIEELRKEGIDGLAAAIGDPAACALVAVEGCGSYGGNSVSGNVQAINLLNIKRIARRNNNMQWFKIPAKTYFEPNAIKYLRDMYGIERAVIVCDKVMEQLGIVDKVIDQLRARSNRVTFRIVDYVEPEPSVETVERGAAMMRDEFEPDTIIAVGGGSPMDAAKIMWLLYEHPEISFSDVREKFFDIRKRAFKIPPLGKKAKLVCIPTSSGTGSEVTPFAVITDHKTGYKYPITDYALTPSVAIVDPVLARTQPRRLASDAGFDALTHSMEAYVSVYANDFTDGMALHAAKLIWDNLAESVNSEPGTAKTKAQEKMHNAATMAGMAFGSAFLGMCHAMAHTIGALCHIAHGRTNSILLPYVIRYNGQVPQEPTSWPKYSKYIAPERYQELAKNLGLDPGKTPAEGVENLAAAVEDYRDNKLGMNKSFQDCGVDEDYFWSILEQIGMRAYEDQCAPANPRIPQIQDMMDIAIAAYYGVSMEEGHKMRVEREGLAATEEASQRV